MQSIAQPLPGVHLLQPKVFSDLRGTFVKTFHTGRFAELGIDFTPVEEFFSISHQHVLRGMHFQLPPHGHSKLVYCIYGRVLDVLLDLRRGETYGHCASEELSAANRHQFFIPSGIAHGFLALEPDSVMVYQTSAVHTPTHDDGIRWDSFGFEWPDRKLVISDRDTGFVPLPSFMSPF
jgi:dTDP-4-dehydrorhamnose 3,5-epimerase/CDP-3, 6-dideoxy-D-glycero-D-glycero-4-hexulose-5-epimerase